MDEWMDQGEASSSMTLASLGASFTDIRFNSTSSTSTFLIPLPYATWISSAVNGASSQYCFLPFSPMVCVCVASGYGTCGPRARALAASMFSCMCHVSLTSPSLQSTSLRRRRLAARARRGRLAPLLSPVHVVPQVVKTLLWS